MKVLVLGGTGFVGKNVVEALGESPDLEVASASLSLGYDLREKAEVERALKRMEPDVVVNCAAHVGSLNYVTEFAGDVLSNNTKMIMALYEAIAPLDKKKLVINPVANCAYPGQALVYKEDEFENGPVHPSVLSYGSSRRLLLAFSKSFKAQYGVETINLLVPNMYGEYDSEDPNKAHALNALIGKFVKGDYEGKKTIDIWGSGKVVREWLYAKDFGRIVTLISTQAALRSRLTENINIAQNHGLSITELANIINDNFNNSFDLAYDTSKPDGAPKKVMDDKKFREVFPKFCFTDFNQGIARTIEYYKTRLPY